MARNESGRQRAYMVWGFLLAVFCGGLYIVFDVNPIPVFAVFGALVVVVALIARPTWMFYFTMFSCCFCELQELTSFHFAFSDRIPIFWNTNTIFQTYLGMITFHYIPMSPFEMLLILSFTSWLIRQIADRTLKIKMGSLMIPVGAYFAMVLYGVFNGQLNGAQLNIELFEVRAQVYFFFGYVMAMNGIVEPRQQVRSSMWIAALVIIFKALFAFVRYYLEQGGHTTVDQGIGSHEESFFFDAYIILLLTIWFANIEPKLRTVMLAGLPFVLMMDLTNQRRAATAALIFGLPVVLILAYAGFKERRRLILTVAGAIIAVTMVYLPLYWNSDSSLGQPARAIKSQFSPDARDEASNLYRDQEDYNLYQTMRQTPTTELLGYGYGRPYLLLTPMVDLTNIDPLIQFIPHDQILWVWMRVGTIGFVIFWIMFAIIVICCTQVAKEEGYYPDIRATGIYATTLVIMLLLFGLLDMQLSNIRDMLFVSMWVGNLAYMRSYYLPIKPDEAPPMMSGWATSGPRQRVRVTSFGEQGQYK